MKTKKDKSYSYEHTKQRALERYGIELTPAIYEEWNSLCTYKSRIQEDKGNGQVVHEINWHGRLITLVQSLPFKNQEPYIKTVLPEGTKLNFGKGLRDLTQKMKVSDWYKYGSTTQQK